MPRRALLCAVLLAALACATPPWHRTTLYEDLGGEQGISRIVSAFLDRLADDERIVHFFDHTNMDRFERLLREQLCLLSDGPCAYSGDSMDDVHRGLHISEADFDALVEDLERAMDDVRVPFSVQSRLLARLAPLRREIIERAPWS